MRFIVVYCNRVECVCISLFKDLVMRRVGCIAVMILLLISSAFADGTKQLWPNTAADGETPSPTAGKSNNQCFLALGSREGGTGVSRPFARYNADGTSCDEDNRLYFRVKPGESVCLGFGGYMANGGSASKTPKNGTYGTVQYRICKKDGTVVKAAANLPSSGDGLIESYAEAYYGPKVVDAANGYDPIKLTATDLGCSGDYEDYYLEFYIGSNFGVASGQPFDISLFDVTVIDGNNKPQSGRLWSKAWGLNANHKYNEVWASFYTMSTDKYISKVYMKGVRPYRFVFGCNSFGAQSNSTMEENRKSCAGNTFQPEYLVFLTRPDADFMSPGGSVAQVPNIPEDLSFAGDAMSCEDLLFVVQLLYTQDAKIELLMDTDKDGKTDMVIASDLQANKIQNRGYHYPWKDNDAITEAGIYYYTPNTYETLGRNYVLSLFDQRFTVDGTQYNVGDEIPNDLSIETSNFDVTLGSKNNPILISSQAELEALADSVNSGGDYSYTITDFYDKSSGEETSRIVTIPNNDNFKDVHFYITAPTITLGSDWPGIGTSTNPFQGTLRSGKYRPNPIETSSTLKPDENNIIEFDNSNVGLFAYCGEGAVIDNIHVKGSIIQGANSIEGTNTINVGGICAVASGTKFQYCSNSCKIESTITSDEKSSAAAGIVAYSSGCVLESCSNFYNDDKLGITANYAGGIIGISVDNTSCNACYNIASITGDTDAGGIIGLVYNGTVTVTNSKNDNLITSSNGNAGGIIGEIYSGNANITDCENNGMINGSLLSSGILGSCNGEGVKATITYCVNKGDVVGGGSRGYIAWGGTIKSSVAITSDDCYVFYDESGTVVTDCQDGNETSVDEAIADIDGSGHFCYDSLGNYAIVGTYQLNKTYRIETAGRLFKSDNTFYIRWDGKDSDGECVTGELTVRYQKNSGVTHFPFFDPENIDSDGVNGLVAYRISPIQDSITKFNNKAYWDSEARDGKEGATQYQRNNYTYGTDNAESVYGYTQLPANYYQTNTMSDEYGIELNLYWDDRNISYEGKCDRDSVKSEKDAKKYYRIGETKEVKKYSETYKYYDNYYWEKQGRNKYKKVKYTGCTISGVRKGYCTEYAQSEVGDLYCARYSGSCSSYYSHKVLNEYETTTCTGIENVSYGGYLGSEGAGHSFPLSEYGNNYTVNTWWNGVEVQSLKTLVLDEYSPPVLLPLLPIEISRWVVTNLEESVLLEWTTASEDNNNYFTVERSLDGITWTELGKLQGAGTTSMSHSYSFEDTKPLSGISYYRIRQTDFNGESTCSSIKSVNRPRSQEDLFKAYTIADKNYFVVEGDMIAACAIEVYDVQGRKITKVSYHTAATSRVNIDAGNLPMGTYIIKTCNVSKRVVKNW